MSYEGTIIPRSIKGFDVYIRQTNAYLILGTPQNASRFNWTGDNLAFWQDVQARWLPLHLQYEDKKGQYTTDVKERSREQLTYFSASLL